MSSAWIVAYGVLACAVLLCLSVLVGLLRRVVDALSRVEDILASAAAGMVLEGLPPGSAMPTFTALTSDGRTFSDSDVRGKPAVIIFLDSECGPCHELARELGSLEDAPAEATVFAVQDRVSGRAGGLDLGPHVTTLLQDANAVSKAFRSSITPNAIAIDPDGIVAARAIPGSLAELQEMAMVASNRGKEADQPELTDSEFAKRLA